MKKRHLRPSINLMIELLTLLSAIYCIGTEDTFVCLATLTAFIAGCVILAKWGGQTC